jgi:hypothetical protein
MCFEGWGLFTEVPRREILRSSSYLHSLKFRIRPILCDRVSYIMCWRLEDWPT